MVTSEKAHRIRRRLSSASFGWDEFFLVCCSHVSEKSIAPELNVPFETYHTCAVACCSDK